MHMGHVDSATIATPVLCAECHVVPIVNNHATGTVNMTFGTLAKTGGVSPTWNAASATCSSTYCHGNFSGGAGVTSPVWTGGTVSCTSCHGNPPATPPHANTALACSLCHGPGYTNAVVNTTTHMNGKVDVTSTNLTCTTCHGTTGRVGIAGSDAQQASAPPVGVHGETAATTVAVGVHQAHLNQTSFSNTPVPCNACHAVPTVMLHATGTVTVTFGGMSKTGGVTPVWSGTGCSNMYCHGDFPNGANATESWTGGAMTCTSCHGNPPNSGHHGGPHGNCPDCHGAGYTTSSADKTIHMNGKLESTGPKDTYNPATKQCTPTCHGPSTW
jgi:predicted CxxxxCH...CXXCH cytochrome family protein